MEFLLFGILGYVIISLGLIASQAPKPKTPESRIGLNFSNVSEQGFSDLPELQKYKTRNGDVLKFRSYPSYQRHVPKQIFILIHGSGWHGMQFHKMASTLADLGTADIVVPDLRGHGASPKRRGDIDYIEQLEDDIADLIAHVSECGAEVILGGHSSGGGLVVRFAGGTHGPLVDRYVLLAPFLKHNAPTTRRNAGGWANPAVRRIIGISMLNGICIKTFNHLPVISFSMPKLVLDGPLGHTATTTYSYRLNTGYAPRGNYKADIAKMTQPFLVISGGDDESFYAEQYEPVISAHSGSGTYVLKSGIDHLGVAQDDSVIVDISSWITASHMLCAY